MLRTDSRRAEGMDRSREEGIVMFQARRDGGLYHTVSVLILYGRVAPNLRL